MDLWNWYLLSRNFGVAPDGLVTMERNCAKHTAKAYLMPSCPFWAPLASAQTKKMQCIGTHLDIHEILHATNEFKTVRVRLHKGHSGGTVQQGHSFFLVALLPSGNHGILFPNPFLYSYPSAGSLGLATWLWASQCCLETGRFTCFATKLTFQPVAASSQGKKPVTSSALGRQPGVQWTKQDILPKGLWKPFLRGTTRVIPGNCWSKAVLISSADQVIGKLLMWSWSAIPQKFWRVSVEDYF